MPLIRRDTPERLATSDAAAADAFSSLTSRDGDERRAAARAFTVAAHNSHVIATAIKAETDDRVLQALFTALIRSANSPSVDVAVEFLRSDNAGLRTAALDALRTMQDQVLPRMAGLLSDPDADVRILVCELVREQQPDTIMDLLLPMLSSESNGNVCGAAIDVLAEVAAPEHVALLLQCAARFPSDPFLDFAAKTAALRIGTRNAAQ